MSNRKIRRSTCVAVCDWWESNGAPPKDANQPPQLNTPSSDVFIGYNSGSQQLTTNDIFPGARIKVLGFYPSTISYAKACKNVLNNRIKFEVNLASIAEATTCNAVALTGANQGRMTRFRFASLPCYFCNTYIPVYYDETNDPNHANPDWNHRYLYVTKTGVATDDDSQAYAYLRYQSGTAAYDAGGRVAVCFCEIIPASGGSGGGGGQGTLMTQYVMYAASASVASDYIVLSFTGKNISYYGES